MVTFYEICYAKVVDFLLESISFDLFGLKDNFLGYCIFYDIAIWHPMITKLKDRR